MQIQQSACFLQDNLRLRLSQNLKSFRKSLGLTQSQLAQKAGVSAHTINSMEICRLWPSDSTLQKIGSVLGVDAVTLLLPV